MDFVKEISSDFLQINDEVVRLKLSTERETEEWVTELMRASKVTWSITTTLRTPPEKARKHTFKRFYHCHFNTRYGSHSGPRIKNHVSRNISCPALMTITLVYAPKNKSRAKFPIVLAQDWPCVIQFSGVHNHTILSDAALNRRPIGDSTKQEILEYFLRGHSVPSAYHSFCFKKMVEWREEYNKFSIDRHYFPNKTDFQNLWMKHNHTERKDSEIFNKLEETLKNNKVSYKICSIDDHYAISFCTPLMKRATTSLVQASEILFVDNTSNCDRQNHKIYFFATQSAIGRFPLGCVISTSRKEELFDIAVKDLLDIHLNNISPKLIFTDYSERKSLESHFPDSKVLLCTFHVLKDVWKWLNNSRHNIPKEDKSHHYKLFKNVLYSRTEKELDVNIAEFQSECKFANYRKYIDQKLQDIESWCLYYRKHLLNEGSDINDNVEVIFRLFKDIPLERTKAYNLTQLTDFIISDFENYYKQRVSELYFNNITKNTIDRLCPNEKDFSFSQIEQIQDLEFYVHDEEKETKYFVDLSIGICSCPVGSSGKICEHRLCIISKMQVSDVFGTLTKENRNLFFKIATGTEPPEKLVMRSEIKLDDLLQGKPRTDLIPKLIPILPSAPGGGDQEYMDDNTTNDDANDADSESVELLWGHFIKNLDKKVRTGLKDDPEKFTPAIRSVASFQKNINSSSDLISSLHTLFTEGISSNTTCKNKEKGVKPMSVARRQNVITERKIQQSGRKTAASLKNKQKIVLSLSECLKTT